MQERDRKEWNERGSLRETTSKGRGWEGTVMENDEKEWRGREWRKKDEREGPALQ